VRNAGPRLQRLIAGSSVAALGMEDQSFELPLCDCMMPSLVAL
jgi:hypothetical protein